MFRLNHAVQSVRLNFLELVEKFGNLREKNTVANPTLTFNKFSQHNV